MLKVVKEEKVFFALQKMNQLALLILVALKRKSQGSRGGGHDMLRRTERSQCHEPDAVREEIERCMPCFHRQARFPRSAKSMQGDQPDFWIFQQADQVTNLFFPSNDGDQLGGQVMQ